MDAETKATITVDNKVVTFEGPRDFVETQVARYIGSNASSDIKTHSEVRAESLDLRARPVLTERQLVLAKKPRGHSEHVAVLAFALAESGHSEFTEEDMRKAYIRAGVKPPKVVAQAIRDAKNGFEYIEG